MKKRDFIKSTAALTMGAFLPSPLWAMSKNDTLRILLGPENSRLYPEMTVLNDPH